MRLAGRWPATKFTGNSSNAASYLDIGPRIDDAYLLDVFARVRAQRLTPVFRRKIVAANGCKKRWDRRMGTGGYHGGDNLTDWSGVHRASVTIVVSLGKLSRSPPRRRAAEVECSEMADGVGTCFAP